MSKDMDLSQVEVEIVGKHPHQGKRGSPTGKMLKVGPTDDKPMFEIRFPDGNGCFACRANMKIIKGLPL